MAFCLRNGVLVDGSRQAVLTATGANIVSPDGGPLQVLKTNPGTLQQVIAGVVNPRMLINQGQELTPITNPGAIGQVMVSIHPDRLISVAPSGGYSLQQISYTASSFSPAATSWRNKTAQTFSWRSAGSGQVTVRLLLAGRSYDLCNAVSVAANACQVQAVDWSQAIRSTSNATLALVDTKSGRALANTNVMISVP